MADNVVEVAFKARTSEFTAGVGEVKTETESLSTVLNEQFSRMSGFIREPLDALAMMKSSLRETAEIAGAVFAVDKVKEFASSMAELGERTVNMAAAVGTTPGQFSLLSRTIQLVTGDSEISSRVLLHLGNAIQEALTEKSSRAAKAAQSLGISQQELRAASNDLQATLDLLADTYEKVATGYLKATDFQAFFGRGMEKLVPALAGGKEHFHELEQAARATGSVLDDETARAMADTGEKIHTLAETIEGAGVKAFMALKGAIDGVLTALTAFVQGMGAAISATATYFANQAQIERSLTPAQRALGVIPGYGNLPKIGPPLPAGSPGEAMRQAALAAATEHARAVGAAVSANTGANIADFLGGDLSNLVLGQGGVGLQRPAAPWPEKGGRGGKGAASTEAKDYTAETQRAIEALNTQQKVEDIGYQAQIAHIHALVQEKKITADEGLAQEKAVVEQQLSSDQGYLAKKEALYQAEADHEKKTSNAGLQGVQQVHDQELILAAQASAKLSEYADKAAEAQVKAAEKAAKAAEEAAKKWQDSWKSVGDQVASSLADALDRTETWGVAMRKLLDSIFKDLLKSLFSSLLTGGQGGALGGALFGQQGLAGALGIGGGAQGGILGSLLGAIPGAAGSGIFGSLFSGLGSALGISGLGTSLLGSFGTAAGEGFLPATAGSGILGVLGTIGSFIGGLFSRGGIVPSAAGGWVVPSFQSGGILGMLHQREMVLPANISEGLQNMIAGGGAGGHTFNLNISALDGASVMRMGPSLVAALNSAMRNGSMLRVPS